MRERSRYRLRRMITRNRVRDNVDFVPFVGILLRLLIVFLLASPVMLGGVNIELPRGAAEIIVVKREPLVVSIQRDGSLYLEKDPIKLNTLASRLSELTMGDKNVKVFVKADKDITYNRVITVVDAIYNAGFFDVTLVTDLRKL